MIPTKLRRLPTAAVTPGLDVDDSGKRIRREKSVLVLADLWAAQLHRLRERGAVLTQAEDLLGAIRHLAERPFHAVIISTSTAKVGLWGSKTAIDFVKSLKTRTEAISMDQEIQDELARAFEESGVGDVSKLPETLEARARANHGLTPFFVVTEGDQEFAIIVKPPDHSYLEDGKGISLVDAVMCLDVGKLLLRGPPLA